MKFNEKVRLLKEKVGDKVLFVQNGNFYIAIGKDAVLLNELFNFKKYFINFKKYIINFAWQNQEWVLEWVHVNPMFYI